MLGAWDIHFLSFMSLGSEGGASELADRGIRFSAATVAHLVVIARDLDKCVAVDSFWDVTQRHDKHAHVDDEWVTCLNICGRQYMVVAIMRISERSYLAAKNRADVPEQFARTPKRTVVETSALYPTLYV